MAHAPEIRANVRRLYIEGQALTTAAALSDVSYATAVSWKNAAKEKGDDWDTARAATRISEQGIDTLNQQMVEDFARMFLSTMSELESTDVKPQDKVNAMAQMSDAYSKFSRAFQRINPSYSGLAIGLDTLKIIVEYLRINDPVTLEHLHGHLDGIGAEISRRYDVKAA